MKRRIFILKYEKLKRFNLPSIHLVAYLLCDASWEMKTLLKKYDCLYRHVKNVAEDVNCIHGHGVFSQKNFKNLFQNETYVLCFTLIQDIINNMDFFLGGGGLSLINLKCNQRSIEMIMR